MDVIIVTEAKKTPKRIRNRNQAHKAIKRHIICITDSDNDYILDEFKHIDTIEYERDIIIDDNEDQFT